MNASPQVLRDLPKKRAAKTEVTGMIWEMEKVGQILIEAGKLRRTEDGLIKDFGGEPNILTWNALRLRGPPCVHQMAVLVSCSEECGFILFPYMVAAA